MSTDPKKHIVVLAHSPNIGGAELALKSLIDSLPGYAWTVVIPTKKPIDDRIRNSGVSYRYLELPWWCHEAHDPPENIFSPAFTRNLEELKRIAQTADMLLTNTITIPWLGPISRSLNKPHIWYIHEFGNIDHNLQFVLGYENSLTKISELSDRVLTISESIKEHLSKIVEKSSIDLVRQSIDFSELASIEPPDFSDAAKPVSLLMLGAIKPSKGQLVAVEALKSMSGNPTLSIVGPPADPSYAQTVSLAAKEDPRIMVELRAYDPKIELGQHSVLLMCSQNEGLGRVTLESMAASRPVLGFSCLSTEKLLEDERGYLYSPNTPEALSKLIGSVNFSKFDPKPAKQFVLENYNLSVQAEDFKRSVKKALSSPDRKERGNLVSEYLGLLKDRSLLISREQYRKRQLSSKIKRHLVTPIKSAVKKIISRT